MRLMAEIAYHGAAFNGWQRQTNAPSVQQCIEEQLTKMAGMNPVAVVGCGRTDTGVHSHRYFLHFEWENEAADVDNLAYRLNKMLPHSIAVHRVFKVDGEMHARFSATRRTYRYFIHRQKDPFLHDRSWWVSRWPDFDAMNRAGEILMGYDDFASFCKAGADNKTTLCKVDTARWVVDGDVAYFEIAADRFLRNMVRAVVGTLMQVGLGQLSPEDMHQVIRAGERGEAGESVPARGLSLWNVEY